MRGGEGRRGSLHSSPNAYLAFPLQDKAVTWMEQVEALKEENAGYEAKVLDYTSHNHPSQNCTHVPSAIL